jgi:hypothetical protein
LANAFVYADGNNTESKSGTWVTFKTTEKMPWMDCKESPKDSVNQGENWWVTVYECTVEPWMESLMKMIAGMIKYFTYITLISAVLFIVINGIMYSMSWMDSGMKDEAKKRIVKTLGWIVVLLLSGYFLNLFFPWIFN